MNSSEVKFSRSKLVSDLRVGTTSGNSCRIKSKHKRDIKIDRWNVRSFQRPKAFQSVVEEVKRYREVIALQKTSWAGENRLVRVRICFTMKARKASFDVDFMINKKILSTIGHLVNQLPNDYMKIVYNKKNKNKPWFDKKCVNVTKIRNKARIIRLTKIRTKLGTSFLILGKRLMMYLKIKSFQQYLKLKLKTQIKIVKAVTSVYMVCIWGCRKRFQAKSEVIKENENLIMDSRK